jgi:anti-sigma factor (TIGR02949 family)
MTRRNEIGSCEEALRLLAEYLDRELERPREEALERHLEICRSCYSRAEFERALKARLTELGEETVRPELSDRVHTLVRAFPVGRST